MLTSKEHIGIYGIAAVFIAVNCYLFLEEVYILAVLPAVLALFWLAFKHPQKTFLFIAFATPLSLKVTFDQLGGASINLPSEPLMILLMCLFWASILLPFYKTFDANILKHPLSLVILFNLTWILVTSATSAMPVVSLKFFIARLWFVTIFYLMAVQIFRRFSMIKKFIWAYSGAFFLVIIYTLIRHAGEGFIQSYANYAAHPFFSDHGVYAAVITLFLPIVGLMFYKSRTFELPVWVKPLALGLFTLLSIALVLSYTRAAWVGMGIAVGAFIIFMLRIKFHVLLIAAMVAVVGLVAIWPAIEMKLSDNKTVSDSNFEAHVQSIYNIRTDASNTERINRWKSAWRMFKERPLTGWGPGSYMFLYAPFQLSHEMTIISTNTGALGNAHSEYIGPLAESGVLGTLSFVVIVLVSIYYGMKLFYYHHDKKVRLASLGIVMGLITYFAHGFLNNYLDSDKAAVPFWAFMAMLTAFDMYYGKEKNPASETSDATVKLK